METNPSRQEAKNKKRVKCLSCKKEVEVTPIPYGEGKIAHCPECGELAYNEPQKTS